MIQEKFNIFKPSLGESSGLFNPSLLSEIHNKSSLMNFLPLTKYLPELTNHCEDIKTAITNHQNNNGTLYHMVFTARHKRTDNIKILLPKMYRAKQEFWRSYILKKLRKELGLKGHVSNVEVTYSDKNGFHPHFHILLFAQNNLSESYLLDTFYNVWAKSLRQENLSVNKDCFSLTKGIDNNYLTKLACEVSGNNKGSERGLSMWGLAHKAMKENSHEYLSLFFKLHEALKGRRMVLWSRVSGASSNASFVAF